MCNCTRFFLAMQHHSVLSNVSRNNASVNILHLLSITRQAPKRRKASLAPRVTLTVADPKAYVANSRWARANILNMLPFTLAIWLIIFLWAIYSSTLRTNRTRKILSQNIEHTDQVKISTSFLPPLSISVRKTYEYCRVFPVANLRL